MDTLDPSITSRQVECGGLSFHVLECGRPGSDLILLLHGFPELAFSWRKVLPSLAAARYHVIAPDMRGYGQTVALDKQDSKITYDASLAGFGMMDTIAEITTLVYTIHAEHHPQEAQPTVKLVVGHDMGSAVAANLALARPDIFKSLIMMSAPYTGPPSPGPPDASMQARLETVKALDTLQPPRKHYEVYFCQSSANEDMLSAQQGLAQFYRGYYYYKSAHWHENKPRQLGARWTLDALASLPEYYVMQRDKNMSETVHAAVKDIDMSAEMHWMSNAELAYYVASFQRTGFQGGLNHYRVRLGGVDQAQLALFAGRRIQVPCAFISGAQDWGNYQDPGGLEKMQSAQVVEAGMFKGCTFVPGAGHWVQQEQPQQTVAAILDFLATNVP